MEIKKVRIILGSDSDKDSANEVLQTLRNIGIPYKVSVASCHWHTGDGFESFIKAIPEELIAYIGGMQFAAPGIAETINKVSQNGQKIILAVPTDKEAARACQNFPEGTAVFTAGFNRVSLKHFLKNSALGIAKLYAWKYSDFELNLQAFFARTRAKKPIRHEIVLNDGLIP